MVPSSRMHDNTLLTFKSKMAAGLTPGKTFISPVPVHIIIILKSIHRFWDLRNTFIHLFILIRSSGPVVNKIIYI